MLDIGHINAIARDSGSINLNNHLRKARLLFGGNVGRPLCGFENMHHLVSFFLEDFEIITKNLDSNLPLDTGNRLFNVILNDLREIKLYARKHRKPLIHFTNQRILRGVTPSTFGL